MKEQVLAEETVDFYRKYGRTSLMVIEVWWRCIKGVEMSRHSFRLKLTEQFTIPEIIQSFVL